MTNIEDVKSKEELTNDLITEIQALSINTLRSLSVIRLLLIGVVILGIVALAHFW